MASLALGTAQSLVSSLLRRFYSLNQSNCVGIHGYNLHLNRNDGYQSGMISALGVWEPGTTKLFLKQLRSGDVVVDVGANIGWFTMLSAKLVGSGGMVLSFEPETTNFEILHSSVSANHFGNVIAFQSCVSSSNGIVVLNVTDSAGLHSILTPLRGKIVRRVSVPTVRLDDITESLGLVRIDLLKIDVEGAEPLVLSGASKLLDGSKIRSIIMEWNPQSWQDFRELQATLLKNYRMYRFSSTLSIFPPRQANAFPEGPSYLVFQLKHSTQ